MLSAPYTKQSVTLMFGKGQIRKRKIQATLDLWKTIFLNEWNAEADIDNLEQTDSASCQLWQ